MAIEPDPLIDEKNYRVRENKRKVDFILKKTALPYTVIQKAAMNAGKNYYHNFGHQLGAAETVILIAKEMGVSHGEITLLAFCALFHDAGHTGFKKLNEEMIAAAIAMDVYCEGDMDAILPWPIERQLEKVRDIILATPLCQRGNRLDVLERIMQDGDLGHIGKGPMYWLWSCMGLLDELNVKRKPVGPIEFIRNEQSGFLEMIKKMGGGQIYLTKGARAISKDPEKSLRELQLFPDEAITYAYSVRQQDITFDEFEVAIQKIF